MKNSAPIAKHSSTFLWIPQLSSSYSNNAIETKQRSHGNVFPVWLLTMPEGPPAGVKEGVFSVVMVTVVGV